ncbi:hypothetical protein P22_2302 [Propionispora sp. 2/2-37]|uniref:metal ABC transporter permease n=1 Tax=Propionispora sp. 2/2-37 TaxID=1677858 RepID=UPI0006C3D9B2|nr:metal ABC transporter permease [Propionispora sp. 2/2-37]CUH96213.1 hypothetical protein P22_2302 [Propionispora sp. 2/2-37]
MVLEFLQYDFMQRAFAAGLITAVVCPLIGIFVVVRRQSLIGDGLGHIAFAGVAAGHMAGIYPIVGALLLTLGGAVGIELIRRRHSQYSDMGLAIIFYAGVAMAIILSTMTKIPSSGLLSFLFGSIVTVTGNDVLLIAISGSVICIILYFGYNQLLLAAFNEDIAKVSGINTGMVSMVFSILTALVVVVGMTIVGILLVSALMIVPVAAAHLLHKGFKTTAVWAVCFSVLSVVTGLTSSFYLDVAPGGTIVMTAIALYIVTGMIQAWQSRSVRQ